MFYSSGAFWFGLVIGWVTYRTLLHKATSGISDIAAVVGAVGGSAVLTLFPAGSQSFDFYAFGLAIGFFVYLVVSLIIAARSGEKGKKAADTAKAFLGDK